MSHRSTVVSLFALVLLIITSAQDFAFSQDTWNQELDTYDVQLEVIGEDDNYLYTSVSWNLLPDKSPYPMVGLQIWTWSDVTNSPSLNVMYPDNDEAKKWFTDANGVMSGKFSYAIPKAPSLDRGHTLVRANVYGYINSHNQGRDRSEPIRLTLPAKPIKTPTPMDTPTTVPANTATPTITPKPTYTPTLVPDTPYNKNLSAPTDLSVTANEPVFGEYRFGVDTSEPSVRFTLWSAKENPDGKFFKAFVVGSEMVSSVNLRKSITVPVGSAIALNQVYAFTAESSHDGKTFSEPVLSEIFAPGPNYFEAASTSEGISLSWPMAGSKTQLQLWRIPYDAYATASRAEVVPGGEVFLTDETEYFFGAEKLNLIPGDDYFVMVVSWLGWDRQMPLEDQSTGVMTTPLWTPPITYEAGAFPRNSTRNSIRVLTANESVLLQPLTAPRDRYGNNLQ